MCPPRRMHMKGFAQHLKSIGVWTFVVVIAAATIPLPKPTPVEAAGSAPVTIVNSPLPVTLSGTGSITGNVTAAQGGDWSVGVTSLPAVQLAPGTTVGITASNTTTSPIFSKDVDEPAKTAYVVFLCASTESSCDGASVPVGTRYVIEQVSGSCNVGSGSSLY